MLIKDMDLARLMIHVQQVEENKLKDREKFKNNRTKTLGNEFRQQKSNVNRSSLTKTEETFSIIYKYTCT